MTDQERQDELKRAEALALSVYNGGVQNGLDAGQRYALATAIRREVAEDKARDS